MAAKTLPLQGGPRRYLQYALNTARERELIDKVVLRLGEHRNAAVLAFEHDGLFLYWPDKAEKLAGSSRVRCAASEAAGGSKSDAQRQPRPGAHV